MVKVNSNLIGFLLNSPAKRTSLSSSTSFYVDGHSFGCTSMNSNIDVTYKIVWFCGHRPIAA
jgi:hypothetical protein